MTGIVSVIAQVAGGGILLGFVAWVGYLACVRRHPDLP